MPDLSGTPVVILCEGQDDYDFARGYLEQLGVRRFVPRITPEGAGSAWVRDQFPAELAILRAKGTYRNWALVAMIDGDGQKPTERKRELEHSAAMQRLGQSPRQPRERALIIVPMRHLEAWFEFVLTVRCDEQAAYARQYQHGKQPKKWGKALARKCQTVTDRELTNWPAALRDACDELRRL